MTLPLLNSNLEDRILWFDGSSTVSEEQLQQMIAEGQSLDKMFAGQLTPTIQQFNRLVPEDQRIQVKKQVNDITAMWVIPNKYKDLDIRKFIQAKLDAMNIQDLDYLTSACLRVETELDLYAQLNLLDVLRTLIYVINTLQNNNIVWGVGRGSSVSSYVLYLLGVHDVDSIKYELDFKDFLRAT